MKRFLRKWLLPFGIQEIIKKIMGLVNFYRYDNKDILNKNRILKNIAKGRRAFLLATGPSIKFENIKLLQGEDCFSISNFFLHEDINLLEPKIHFFAPYHKPLILEEYISWLKKADETLPENTSIALGHETKDLVDKYEIFKKREIYYVYLGSPYREEIDITKPILPPQTGPLMIIPFLLYMGYKEIYLLGCDHNMLKDYGHKVEHFYKPSDDMRSNSSDDWLDIIEHHDSSKNIFAQYLYYKKIIEKKGNKTKIINLSKNSWLKFFPFDNLENLNIKRSK